VSAGNEQVSMEQRGTLATLLRQGYGAPSIDGQTGRSNGALGKATWKAKPRWVAASELGSDGVSNGREH